MEALVALVLLVAVAAGLAALLRSARCPAWSILGGLAAGLVLGPTIAGHAFPTTWRAYMDGPTAAYDELDRTSRLHGAESLAALMAGLDDGRLADMRRRHQAEIRPLERSWQSARETHQRARRVLGALCTAFVLFAAGGLGVAARGLRVRWIHHVSAGLWAAAIPAAIAFYTLNRWWDQDVTTSLLIAAAVGVGPWTLTIGDRDAADDAEIDGASLVQVAGWVATLVAIGAIIVAFGRGGATTLYWALPLLAAPVGWILAERLRPRAMILRAVSLHVMIPIMAAIATSTVRLPEDIRIWPIVVILLISGDGRWFGAYVGAMSLGGRAGLRTLRLVMGSMACGPTQVGVICLGVSAGLLSGPFVFAALLGAVLIDLLAPVRRIMARRLMETERELAELQE